MRCIDKLNGEVPRPSIRPCIMPTLMMIVEWAICCNMTPAKFAADNGTFRNCDLEKIKYIIY